MNHSALTRCLFLGRVLVLVGATQICVVQAAVGAADPAKAAATTSPALGAAPKGSMGRTGLDDRIRVTAEDGAAVRSGKRNGGGRYLMRCWQYGRLVFEEARDTLLVESPKVITVGRSQEPGETIQVLDMVSTSCVLSAAP